ncbi:MAG: ATP-dependent RNA helicase HrpA, partial [Planctomycetota bacterium]
MLEGTFGPDRAAIRRLHRRDPSAAAELARDSRERVLKRTLDTPEIAFPAELPFSSRVDDIRSAIESSRVVILSGETGSGKSTQLPKLCLAMGRGAAGLIGHTQPRRLAARSVAARVASELGGTVGGLVGAKVRFGDDTSAETRIKLMTDGVLLAESRRDRDLEQYDTIIVDEAHERSLNIDFLLGLLCRVVGRRDDLKIIVTSATIDAQRFADHFEQALHERVPVIEVSGRTYPVDIVHREPVDDDGWPLDLPDAIADAAERLAVRDGFGSAGDVLVFLPGEREIRDAARRLREAGETSRLLSGCEIVPLYARLGMAEQQRVFRRAARRKIVLATNVAETSLTVPGIRYVIDSGVARISRYSTRRRVQSLQVEPISRASARQRAGRCGRTEDGVCIRLFSEADHEARPEFTQPEIQRTNLAGVILQMAELGLGRPEDFPFVDPPDRRRIAEAYDTLRELSAVDADDAITAMGRRLARLPVDPRIGRILVEADELGVLAEALIVASALECQDPRLRPHEQRDAADASHQRFADPASDFIAILRLWDHYHKLKDSLSRAALRRTLEREFLSLVRMREWTDTHRQLRDMVNEIGLRPRRRRDDPAALHRAVLAGFATSVGRKEPNGTFASPLAGRFAIHPASCVRTKGSSWLVVTELLRTTRLFARTAARVDAAWIEHAARHLIRREYGEPMYNPDRGVVEAPSSAWLGQLELSRERLVPYASVDREHARRVFLEQALVDGALRCGAPFETHNAALLAELTDEEAKLRTPRTPTHDMLVGFFDARLPPDVCTARGFDRFRRRTEAEDPTALLMRREDFLDATQDAPDPHGAPESIDLGAGSRARLTYRFEPGSETDGIAAELTLSDAASANADTFEWLVPALLAEKVRAVLTGLPRRVRRQIDLDRTTDAVTSSLRFREGNF